MRNIPIGTRLIAGTAVLFVLLLVSGLVSVSSLASMQDQLDVIADQTARKIQLAGEINMTQALMLSGQRRIILYAERNDLGAVDREREKFEQFAALVLEKAQELRPMLVTEESREIVARVAENIAAWQPRFARIVDLCRTGRADDAFQLAVDTTVPISNALDKDLDRLVATQDEFLAHDKEMAASLYFRNRTTALILVCLSIIVGSIMAFQVIAINRSLRQAAMELGQGSKQVAEAAAQVSASSQSLAHGAAEQAASIEETSASSEEISAMTRQNAEHSCAAAQVMTQVDQNVNYANQCLEHMMASMHEIHTSSDRISKIIKVIDEIAFQTNILALNAAVEAARAGEAGMGFAVVAGEVRNLAQRSAQAAQDTAGLIEESIRKSSDGGTRLDQVATAMRQITASSSKVKSLVDEVNRRSQGQARGMEQISKAISQMDQVTQQTASSAEQSASASLELSSQAESMHQVIQRLEEMVGAA